MTSRHVLNILVPRVIDADNRNAQNLNAKALLSRFKSPDVKWHVWHYGKPDESIAGRDNICCHQLRRGRGWTWHALMLYQGRYDAIFYPGNESFDARALVLRQFCRRQLPVIATLEGLPGDAGRERWLSARSGLNVQCFRPRSGKEWIHSHDTVHNYSSLVLAISPFLAQMAELLYGKNVEVVSLGVESAIFNASSRAGFPKRPLVLGAGTVYAAKRPQLFLQLAAQFPQADFVWYGEGELRESLVAQAKVAGLGNLAFAGALAPMELAACMKRASLFVLPSLSEGVPKVAQEAAACGLPVILFAHYHAPVVADGINGFAVQHDDELVARVGELLAAPEQLRQFGQAGAAMALQWDWQRVANDWETRIIRHITAQKSAGNSSALPPGDGRIDHDE